MKTYLVSLITPLLLALGCAGSYPPPTQQLADVQSADRSANELGAQSNPKAQLHLKLAEEQMKLAKSAMEDDDNKSADRLLTRAKSDAELAVALTREAAANQQAGNAVDQSNAQRSQNREDSAAATTVPATVPATTATPAPAAAVTTTTTTKTQGAAQ